MAEVARGTSIPIATGERLTTKTEFARVIENGQDETTLYLAKHWVTSGEQTIEIRVDGVPVQAGIDPRYKLVDRNKDDNVVDVTVGGEGS